jgi:DNA-binding NarL/FixJ family response regulator
VSIQRRMTNSGSRAPVPPDGPPADEQVKVLLADDHASTRSGLRAILESDGFVVCAEVGDGPSAVTAAHETQPSICLLDVHMPGSGISAAARITAELPGTAVVMLTVSYQDDDLFAALEAGASGYLLKDTDPSRLPYALRGVLQGEAAVPRYLMARVIDRFRSRGSERLHLAKRRGAALSSREWEVLELMREGLSTAEMAERLFVSKVTVRSHVASILRKLQAPDRASALRLLA